MGKNKLKKFAEMEHLDMVFQYPFARLKQEAFPYRGSWNTYFANNNPLTIELGCGKGEYTVGLARADKDANFIGFDIKGARMWTGAKEADRDKLVNVAFVRTSIELLEQFFGPGEVSTIWITFPDPQMRKVNKRLTGTRFIELYRKVLAPGGVIKLKTDSPFLYAYTKMMCEHNGIEILRCTDNLYASPIGSEPAMQLKTHYEKQWMDRGLTIKYIEFRPGNGALSEPPEAENLEPDTYRSYSRGYIQMPGLMDCATPAE